jgi:hypothetical protein
MKTHLINKDCGNVEYIIKSKDKKNGDIKTTLKRSKSDVWTEHAKNEKLIEIIDDGIVYDIDILDGEDSMVIRLDYSQVAELYLVLDEIRKTSNLMPKYKRVFK